MASKKIIVVTGATGLQGGSVARFLLNDGTFAVRAMTRNSKSPAIQELVSKGAEVAQADLNDLESLKKAMRGAYGVFGVTNFWAPEVGYEGEVRQGKNLVNAAKATGIQHFVWSTLDHTTAKPSHWESKAEVDDYLKKIGVPRTSLYTTFFMENFTGSMSPSKRTDGSYDLPLPMITDGPMAIYSAAETGAYALAAFIRPQDWLNKDLRIATAFLSPRQIAEAMSDVSGKIVHVQEINDEEFEKLKGKSLPEEMHDNNRALQDNPKPPFRDPELTRKLYPEVTSFSAWVKENEAALFRD